MDDHYDEIQGLIRREYSHRYMGLQELIAEMVVKTNSYNRRGNQDRFDEILFLLIGHPTEPIKTQKQKNFIDDLRRAASLCKNPDPQHKKVLTVGEAAAVVSRQRFVATHLIGDKVPKNLTLKKDKDIGNYAKKLQRHLKNSDIDQLAREFESQSSEDEILIAEIDSDVGFVKSLISEWLERHSI
ncbi:MAG: hypothetical protein JWO78_1758 [Micavibrio sp.]|nr:hypothetical protein [Micavibrio sp.]